MQILSSHELFRYPIPRVSAGRGGTPAIAIRSIDVGIDSIQSIAVDSWKSSNAYTIALFESIVKGARSSSEWLLARDCFDM